MARIMFFRLLAGATETIALGLWRLSSWFQSVTIWLLKYAICPHGKNASERCADCGDPPSFGGTSDV